MLSQAASSGGHVMNTVDEIAAAAEKLSPAEFLRLQRKLERIERKIWEAELKQTTAELKAARITEEEIDRLVLRRRRESRR
jgi:hypothetical protein